MRAAHATSEARKQRHKNAKRRHRKWWWSGHTVEAKQGDAREAARAEGSRTQATPMRRRSDGDGGRATREEYAKPDDRETKRGEGIQFFADRRIRQERETTAKQRKRKHGKNASQDARHPRQERKNAAHQRRA